MLNLNDLLSSNKLAIKIVAAVVGFALVWANRHFNLGMSDTDIHAAAAIDAGLIIGIALHKPTPPAAAPSAPSPMGTQVPPTDGGQK